MKELKEGNKVGGHGYDPYLVKEMNGIFYAQGPNVKSGVVIPPFENIHLYPLIARILKLTIPEIDGDGKVLEVLYKE